MLTGSLVSSLYGEPRATHDFDILVALTEERLNELHTALTALDGYVEAAGMRRAMRDGTMFNYIDHATGLKVDFWMLGRDPYDEARFARKRAEVLFGSSVWIASPEDAILSKLRWAQRSGGSEKQLTDALRVFEVQRPDLDLDYLERWVDALGLRLEWDRLRRDARVP
ncbi:MAG TPA: hypothetical protein VJS92_10670 [Candidatus Polarisedimenticolaceae bacterium]|nr:hypothetical protein [Candidatus Polarisedimenticolaceae bacterium]